MAQQVVCDRLSRLRASCVVPAAVVALAIGGCPQTMRPPPDGSVQQLKRALGANSYPAPLPDDVPTLLMVITIPGPGKGLPTARALHAAPGDLPPVALRCPSPRAALKEPGLHAALIDAEGLIRYAVAVSDPRLVLHETEDPISDRWRGHAGTRPEGAIALRIPWIAGARLALFAVGDAGQVSEVLGELTLPERRPDGRRDGELQLMGEAR